MSDKPTQGDRIDTLEEQVSEIRAHLGLVDRTPAVTVAPPGPPAPHELYVPGSDGVEVPASDVVGAGPDPS